MTRTSRPSSRLACVTLDNMQKKGTSSLNILIFTTAVSLVAGIVYGGWEPLLGTVISTWQNAAYYPRDHSLAVRDLVDQETKNSKLETPAWATY